MTAVPNPYTPTFLRNPLGSYSEQEAYISVVAGTDALILEDELNEMQWLLGAQRAKNTAQIHSSGSFKAGADTLAAGVLTIQPRDILMNGYPVHVEGTAANNGNIPITLPAGPSSGTRTDLVYVTMALVAVTSTSVVRKYGYQQGDQLNNDIIDTRIGADTTHRIQKQWTVQIATGTTGLTALGYNATTYDTNLYTRANTNAVDGIEYAIPLYTLTRGAGGNDTLTDTAFYIYSYQRIGVPSGLATLDGNGKIPANQINAGNLPIATTNSPGVVRAGSGISVAQDGTLTVDASKFVAQTEVGAAYGVAPLDGNSTIPLAYFNPSSMPTASASSPGVVKGSTSIQVASDGTLTATAGTVGAVPSGNVGKPNGVASLDPQGYVPAGQINANNMPKASATDLGVVTVGTGIKVDTSGKITTDPATVGAVDAAKVGQPNGVAALNSSGQVPPQQVMTVGNTAPPSPAQAWQWFNTTTNRWSYYSGSAWVDPIKYV